MTRSSRSPGSGHDPGRVLRRPQSHGGFQTQDGSTALGVHDMAGNVSEWCADWFGLYTNPHNPAEVGILKIIRGGNWNKGSGSMQTWRRDHVRPEVADFSVGFRTVATAR